MSARDLVGESFGRLRVVGVGRRYGVKAWECVCSCGGRTVAVTHYLLSGKSTHCGCLHVSQNRTHGMSKTPTYRVWTYMITRCTNPASKSFADYGGRGISVCAEWTSFERFLADMGERPTGSSIDRIDNNLGYFKDNCRWSTAEQQCQNRRSNRLNPDLVREIRRRAQAGIAKRQIARELGVSSQLIMQVIARRIWKNVT